MVFDWDQFKRIFGTDQGKLAWTVGFLDLHERLKVVETKSDMLVDRLSPPSASTQSVAPPDAEFIHDIHRGCGELKFGYQMGWIDDVYGDADPYEVVIRDKGTGRVIFSVIAIRYEATRLASEFLKVARARMKS